MLSTEACFANQRWYPNSENESGFQELLAEARSGGREALGQLFQRYGNYLCVLADTQLDRRLRRRLSPSDIVQEAMLAAHQDFAGFRGSSQGELLCWLRTIVIHTLQRSFKKHIEVEKRDIRREVSLEHACETAARSPDHHAGILHGPEQSPIASTGQTDRLFELAEHLGGLRPVYRQVITLRALHGMSFGEIAERMNRSCGAVRMLWHRALGSLRAAMQCSAVGSPQTNHRRPI